MRKHGLVPDVDGLDVDLGRIDSGHPRTGVELVAEVDGAVAGSVVVVATDGRHGKLTGFCVAGHCRGRGADRTYALVPGTRRRG